MKKFILKNIAFTIILFLTALLFDVIISKGLRQNKTKLSSTITKVYQGEINSDLIINGSSKAFVQIDPQIIDSIIGINSYNLGLDGSPFIHQKALFELYKLKNKKPKVVVQVVSNGTLRSLNDGFSNPIKFAPYLDIPVINKHMKLTGGFDYIDYKLPLIKYLGSPFEVMTGMLSIFNINLFKSNDNKGYLPKKANKNIRLALELSKNKDSVNLNKIKEYTSLDTISCKLFEEFLAECKSENILVILVFPPIFTDDSSTIKHINYYNNLSNKYNAHFLDYSKDSSLVFNKDYFNDSQHLNINGATFFTKILAKDIKTKTLHIFNK